MFKKIIIVVLALAVAVGLSLASREARADGDFITIGILQTATHPALDQAQAGFIAELSRLSKGQVKFVVQNAQGSLPQAQIIAESFHTRQKIAAIFAIGTPAVQAATRAEKSKPIIIAAVSDPESLGVIHPGTNVAGTSDRVDVEAQVALIRAFIPGVKTVALLYNPAEHNSQVMIALMQEALKRAGLEAVVIGLGAECEIAQAVQRAARKSEALLLPTDNLLSGAIQLVAREALKQKIPLFESDINLVQKGALAALGADYFEAGKASAEIAFDLIFLNKRADDIGIKYPTDTTIFVNKDVAKTLHLTIPEGLSGQIKLIGGDHAE